MWVAIVLSMPRQCEKPEKKGKTNIVPTPYFLSAFFWELRGLIKSKDMDFSNIFFLLFIFLVIPVVAIISAKDDSEETGGCATIGMIVIAAIIALIIVIAS